MLKMSNTSFKLTTPKLKNFSKETSVDKTGYEELRMRALRKAVFLCSGSLGNDLNSGKGCSIPEGDLETDYSTIGPLPTSYSNDTQNPTPLGSSLRTCRKHVVKETEHVPLHLKLDKVAECEDTISTEEETHLRSSKKNTPFNGYVLYSSHNQDINVLLKKIEEYSFKKEVARLERIRLAQRSLSFQTNNAEFTNYLQCEEIVEEVQLSGIEDEENETCTNEYERVIEAEEIVPMLEEQEQESQRLLKEDEEAKRRREEEELKRTHHEEFLQKEKEKHGLRKIMYKNFISHEKDFSAKYQEFTNLVKGCENHCLLENLQKDVQEAKEANSAVIELIEKCKEEKLEESDILKLQHLYSSILSIVKKFLDETAKVKSTMDICTMETCKGVEIKNQPERTEIKDPSPTTCNETGNTRIKLFEDNYHRLQENLDKTEKLFVEFLDDNLLKQFRTDCRQAVNTPVNAISSVNGQHMLDKFNKLSNLLRGQQVPVKDKKFSAAVHPLGIIYCSNLLAKKIVGRVQNINTSQISTVRDLYTIQLIENQGEKVVSSRPEAAFPIASVTVALWAEFPDFGDLLLAHFHRTCPYLVPILSERLLNETEEEYFRKLGFLYENGEREDLNIFLSRMSGVMRLYCAMMVINIRKELMKPHVIGLWEGWRWCASFVNQEPRAEISATLLFVMLEVTGNALLKKYRHQFQKLLHLICKSYIPKIDQVTKEGRKGPVSRLKNFLETVIYSNTIQPPNGLLHTSFW